MRVSLLDRVDGAWWNGHLGGAPHASVYQTFQWASYMEEYFGHGPRFLVCTDADDKIRGMLLLFRSAPQHDLFLERPFGRMAVKALKSAFPVYTWQQGPVLLGASEDWPEVLRLMLEEVKKLCERRRIGKFTLPMGVDQLLPVDDVQGFAYSAWATYLIDLEKPKEDLWRSLRGSARKAVKKAERDGITVETVDGESGRLELQEFRKASLESRGTRCPSAESLLVRYRWLKEIDAEDIYVAKHGDRVVNSLGIWRFNGCLHEFGSNQSPFGRERGLYGGDLIKWRIIEKESDRGARSYDLCGVNPQPATAKEQSIAQFKKKWGGEYAEYRVYRGK